MTRAWTMLLTLGLLGVSMPAAAQSGATTWGPWRFDWEVKDGAGLALRNVRYRDEPVAYKLSMPVVRVRYDDDACGPFADRITWESLIESSRCEGEKVCQTSFSFGGQQWLEVGVLARIGEYRLYQVWYLSEDGQLTPRLWSSGLQCEVSHDHHAYWRLDLDVGDAGSDQVLVYDRGGPDQGWVWREHATERDDLKNEATGRSWLVRDPETGHGVWIVPGPDGTADGFSRMDVAPRVHHDEEDGPWPFGVWGDLGYDDGESLRGQDVVVWYVAHLRHWVSQGPTDWHWVGPDLRVAR